MENTRKLSQTTEGNSGPVSPVTAKSDMLCLSTQDWNDLWTRKQRFMKRFADEGHRVLYVETQFHWITYVLRFRSQWRRLFAFLKGPVRIDDNLWVYTPPLLIPFFQMSKTLCYLNSRILCFFLKRVSKTLEFKDMVIYNYTPYANFLIPMLGARKVVYECVDDFTASKGLMSKKVVTALENDTLRKSQVTIVTAPLLLEKKRYHANRIHLISNAAEIEKFNAIGAGTVSVHPLYDDIPKNRVGFIGALAYWIDLDLIVFLAEKRPDYQFVFVGPVDVNVSRLGGFKNVHFVGRYPFDQLPGLMAGFDVCINPYVLDGVAAGCSPLKLYEYLASGKPIVSVRMPEAEKFETLVLIGDGYEGMLAKLDEAMSLTPERLASLAQKQIAASAAHGWDSRFAQTKEALADILYTVEEK